MSRIKPAFLKALGHGELPAAIEAGGNVYHYCRTFKNDFFAVTSLYEGPTGKVVLKVQRQAALFLFPLRWMGRLLALREISALRRLEGVAGVPRLIGTWGSTGLVREFIEGRTLSESGQVNDEFHPRLACLIDAVHQRDMAYVDLEKPGNVLVGEDGRPYLFDFQISWFWPSRWGGNLWPARVLRSRLQAGDRYHLIKLQRRSRPDQLSPHEYRASYQKPWFVRLHNVVTRPLTRLRRRVLRAIDPGRGKGERGIVEHKTSGA